MDVFVCKSSEEASRLAGEQIIKQIRSNPALVLGLATGSTPLLLYKELIKACQAGTDFSRIRYVLYGAAPMPPALLRQCLQCFHNQCAHDDV